jgi:N-acetylneuraminic acid mutarotase
VLLDGRVYLIGGYPPGGSDPTPIVDVYDPATDSWSQAADLPMPGADRASCVLAGRIYTISGWQRATNTSPSRMVNLYDPAADEWQQGPDFPRPGHGHAVASVGGRIYVFGGSTGTKSQGVLWEYDPAR